MIAQVIKQISNSGESSADSHKLYKFLQKLQWRKIFVFSLYGGKALWDMLLILFLLWDIITLKGCGK